jgi:hypothetical protein
MSRKSKLLLMDLAQSGITTITKYILLNRVPPKDDIYRATIDYERHELLLGNKEITIYDMGFGGTDAI